MDRKSCPQCGLPKVGTADARPRRTPLSALLMSASGPVTLGTTWALLGYWWLRGDYRPKPVYHCHTCGYEWSS